MLSAVKRAWLPLLALTVAITGGLIVYRIHGYFGDRNNGKVLTTIEDAKPFHPKVVLYEILGPEGAVADINYLDLDAQPQQLTGVHLPWSLTLSTTDPSVFPYIVAQGDSDSISCRISVDGILKEEQTAHGIHAQTFCIVKSA